MSTAAAGANVSITAIEQADYESWERLFRAYIAFYKTSLPDEQYPKTFKRIVDGDGDLWGLGLRKDGNLIGIAHFFPHQTPWNEGRVCLFNDLFIDPEARGKGYGRQMIEAVAQAAKEKGCNRLQWVTQHGNPARKLYDQLGSCDFVQYRRNL